MQLTLQSNNFFKKKQKPVTLVTGFCFFLYIYICMCVYTHTHTHTHTYIYIYIYIYIPYNSLANVVRLLPERSDTKSNVKMGGFWSQLQASHVSSHSEVLWYNETVWLWMTIYIYIYISMCVCVWKCDDSLAFNENSINHIFIVLLSIFRFNHFLSEWFLK